MARPLAEMAQEPLVIDVETEGLGCGVKVGTVNEQGDLFRLCRHQLSLALSRDKNRSSDPPAAPTAKCAGGVGGPRLIRTAAYDKGTPT